MEGAVQQDINNIIETMATNNSFLRNPGGDYIIQSDVSDEFLNSNKSALLNHSRALSWIPLDDSDWLTEEFIQQIQSNFFAYHTPVAAVLIALYALTFAVGIVGNALVIYIFARNKHMRTVTNSFLVNLAVCDLLVVCLCMPFSVAMEAYDNWIYGNVMCKLVNFSQGLAVSSSILTMTVISAERFYAIRRPLKARAFMSRTRIQRIVTYIWCGAALAVLPSVFVRREVVMDTIYTIKLCACMEQWNSTPLKHLYNFALLFILYVAPVLFICVGYMQIGLNLWRTDTLLHAGTSSSESENARHNLAGRRKVARMLFVMAVLFAASWLPVHVLGISLDFLTANTHQTHGIALRHLHSYFLWLGHANSSINPLCYCIMSTSFKAAVRVEMRRLCCCRFDFPREAFRSMSVSLTMSTSNGARRASPPGGAGTCTKLGYRPVRGHPPDLLKHLSHTRYRMEQV